MLGGQGITKNVHSKQRGRTKKKLGISKPRGYHVPVIGWSTPSHGDVSSNKVGIICPHAQGKHRKTIQSPQL